MSPGPEHERLLADRVTTRFAFVPKVFRLEFGQFLHFFEGCCDTQRGCLCWRPSACGAGEGIMVTANRSNGGRHRPPRRHSQRRADELSRQLPHPSTVEAVHFLPANRVTTRLSGRDQGGYAKYIGPLGALAVALGLGAAAPTTPGIAFAEEPDTTAPADTSP